MAETCRRRLDGLMGTRSWRKGLLCYPRDTGAQKLSGPGVVRGVLGKKDSLAHRTDGGRDAETAAGRPAEKDD